MARAILLCSVTCCDEETANRFKKFFQSPLPFSLLAALEAKLNDFYTPDVVGSFTRSFVVNDRPDSTQSTTPCVICFEQVRLDNYLPDGNENHETTYTPNLCTQCVQLLPPAQKSTVIMDICPTMYCEEGGKGQCRRGVGCRGAESTCETCGEETIVGASHCQPGDGGCRDAALCHLTNPTTGVECGRQCNKGLTSCQPGDGGCKDAALCHLINPTTGVECRKECVKGRKTCNSNRGCKKKI